MTGLRHRASIRVAPLLAFMCIAALAVSACGDDDDGGAESPTAAASPTSARTVSSSTPGAAATPTAASAAGTTPVTSPVATSVAPSSAPALCDLSIPDASPGVVASPDLLEISGLAASRTQDVIWAHNDSGDTARVFAVGLDGAALATYTVSGAEAVDWEDMAIGPGPEDGLTYLYLGDIGDNAAARAEIVVYRAPEPTVDPAASSLTVEGEAIALTYPDGAHDAETLLLDPETGDLFIVTKDISGGPSGVYRASAASLAAPPVTLESAGVINFAALEPRREIPTGSPALPSGLPRIPTGGDISPDGSSIAIRTYGTVWIWQRAPGTTIGAAFANLPCEGPSAIEQQGEAIAFDAEGRGYVTASEGANPALHHFRPQ